MATASVHSPSIKTEEFGQFIAMFTRATNMHASLVDLADNESVEKATHPITPKPRWPPAAWDTVHAHAVLAEHGCMRASNPCMHVCDVYT